MQEYLTHVFFFFCYINNFMYLILEGGLAVLAIMNFVEYRITDQDKTSASSVSEVSHNYFYIYPNLFSKQLSQSIVIALGEMYHISFNFMQ